ncbi:acidic leucine-rich nuclear phosphoprotein 32-related protein 1-like isoform X2 [Aristolochia californica]
MLTGRKRKVSLFDVVDQNRVETPPLKKTSISHFAVEAFSHGMIVCTHNHKVAAMSILPCVDEEVDVAISNELGDSIGFKDRSNKMIVKYLKDGMILNKLVRDSLLERYGLMVLDKAHKIKVFKGKKSDEEEELDGSGDDDDDDEASGEEDEDDDEDEDNDDDIEGVEQSSHGPQIQSVDDDDEDDEDGEDEDGEGGDDDDEGDDGDDTDDDEDDGEEEEDMGTEYLVRPVGRAEDEEDASDFEPGEENGEEVEFDDDEDENDDDDDDGGGKGDVLTKRKRSGEEDDGDNDSDGDGDERPSKR